MLWEPARFPHETRAFSDFYCCGLLMRLNPGVYDGFCEYQCWLKAGEPLQSHDLPHKNRKGGFKISEMCYLFFKLVANYSKDELEVKYWNFEINFY